jgi:hypothetical protein
MKIQSWFLSVTCALIALTGFCTIAGMSLAGVITATVAVFSIAVLLYRLREKKRLFYGLLELGVSIISGFLVLQTFASNSHGIAEQPLITRMALLFASVYVMIRALDNIGTGLRGTEAGEWWDIPSSISALTAHMTSDVIKMAVNWSHRWSKLKPSNHAAVGTIKAPKMPIF